MEYNYAVSIGKPTIAFLHKDPSTIIVGKTEATDEGKKKLTAFRKVVEQKLCKQWLTAQELGSVVSRGLIQLTKSTPAVGWARADELADREATLELLRLRRRVEELDRELAKVRTSAPKGAESLARGDEQFALHYTFEARNAAGYTWEGYKSETSASWDEIFAAIAPVMIHEISDEGLKESIDDLVQRKGTPALRKIKDLKDRSLRSFDLVGEDFLTIKVQLRALGLVAKSDKARSVKDSGTYWTLTAYGDEYMTRLRAIKRAISPPGAVG
jgi:hypothetical protein